MFGADDATVGTAGSSTVGVTDNATVGATGNTTIAAASNATVGAAGTASRVATDDASRGSVPGRPLAAPARAPAQCHSASPVSVSLSPVSLSPVSLTDHAPRTSPSPRPSLCPKRTSSSYCSDNPAGPSPTGSLK